MVVTTGWVRERAAVGIKSRSAGATSDLFDQTRHVWWLVGAYLVLAAACFATVWVQPDFLPRLAPAADALSIMWQVQITLVAVGLAGLSLLLQLDPPSDLLAVTYRALLVAKTHFKVIVIVGLTSVAGMGVIATWSSSDGAVALAFVFLFLPSLTLIGFAYLRTLKIVRDTRGVEDQAQEVFVASMRDAIDLIGVVGAANRTLREFVAKADHLSINGVPASSGNRYAMVSPNEAQILGDINLLVLSEAADLLAAEPPVITIAGVATETVVEEGSPRVILVNKIIDEDVSASESVFTVAAPSPLTPMVLAKLKHLLAAAVRWDGNE